MPKKRLLRYFVLVGIICFPFILFGQQNPDKNDTFFLAKKKGLLGKLGRSMSVGPEAPQPVKTANPYIIHTGKTIRSIHLIPLGFDRNLYDTTPIRPNFGTRVAKVFHRVTRNKIISNDLFFKEGEKVHPFLIADNERFLRDQPYLQDARIMIEPVPDRIDEVDVVVFTKDVFSLGGGADIGGLDRMNIQVKEENINGTGSKITLSTLYDKYRNPKMGYGAELLKRNIEGSFINWSVGFQTYQTAFSTGKNESNTIYTHFEKPLVSPYIPWIGAMDLSYNKTSNAYHLSDSLYTTNYQYNFGNADIWFGYNFGSKRLMYKNKDTRLRKFIAVRGLWNNFFKIPRIYDSIYFNSYANISGVLAAISVFKQDFYRANFIYGFGRNEDVPEGFNASIIGGITNKSDTNRISRKRSYYGAEAQYSHYAKKGLYTTYTFRVGGFFYNNKGEDINLLLNVAHITKLRKLSPYWFTRQFINLGFTKQINPILNPPLLLQSEFGLPYFNNGNSFADIRTTAKTEAVFFNMKKLLGFRFAPFVFGDLCLITPPKSTYVQSDLYSAVGAGVRTRNENLVYGTIELKGYFFPRTGPGMNQFKIELNANIRFKFNSSFINKPDFIQVN